MHTTCERCGMSATPRASASRAFCDACHAAAAPHARPSSELLFTLPPPPSPDDARESVPLVELVARAPHPAPRDSLPYASTPWLHAPVVPAPRPRRNLAAALVIAVSAVALGASGALAMHVALGEPPEPEEVERDDAEGDPRAPGAAPPGPSPEPPPPTASTPAPAVDSASHRASDPVSASDSGSGSASASASASASPTPSPRPRRLPRPAPTETRALPTTPSRAAVRDAFAAIHDRIEACAPAGYTGALVTTRVVLRSDGHVQHATVEDASVPPEIRSCVAREARRVRLDPFTQERVSVLYPFRL